MVGSAAIADVSVCIVNWNTRDLLAACLKSVFDELDRVSVETEVIVVDNASTDGSVEMLRCSFSRVKLIANTVNLGFGAANNQAINDSCGTYVLLLNSDAVLNEDSLGGLLGFIEANNQCAAVGPRVLNPDGTLQVSAARFPKLRHAIFGGVFSNQVYRRIFPRGRFFAELGLTPEDHALSQSVDWILGCCMLLRRDALDDVGLFDEGIFVFYEEADLCFRLKHAGWEVDYCAQPTVTHHGGGSYKNVWDVDEQVRRQLVGLEYFHLKHYGRLDLLIFRLMNLVGSAVKMVVFGVLGLLASGSPRDGYRAKVRWHLSTVKWYVRTLFCCRARGDAPQDGQGVA